MKKNVASYHLNRDMSARKALFNNLILNLVDREEIETTRAKAAAVKSLFEKLLTQAKSGTVVARRQVQAVVQNSRLVKKMVDDIAKRYQDVKGGYTTIKMVGARRGDGAMMVKLALTKKMAKVTPKLDDKKASKKAVKEAKVVAAPKLAAPKAEKVNVTKVAARRVGSRGGDR